MRGGRALTNPETRFALILVFAKNGESVSDRFSRVHGNSEDATVGKSENSFPKCYSSRLLRIAVFFASASLHLDDNQFQVISVPTSDTINGNSC